ncbi:MAG: ferritin family protein [Candidatus Coatesbacteria bacterium]|nr:ferritin family protein [Candidatus Coatesbacteria bacterium]
MSVYFNSDEIFEIAIQIEKNGAAFYRKAIKIIENEMLKNLLEKLAKMEDEHEKAFTAMKNELSNFTLDNEAKDYLKAIAGGYVFDLETEPKDIISEENTFEDIVRIAIGLEKDSIAFYSGMKEVMPASFGKDKIDHIIKEEIRHIIQLLELLQI